MIPLLSAFLRPLEYVSKGISIPDIDNTQTQTRNPPLLNRESDNPEIMQPSALVEIKFPISLK